MSESENSKHVEETWTLASSLQPSSSSQVNTIRTIECADEGLWIFSLEDSAKHRALPEPLPATGQAVM